MKKVWILAIGAMIMSGCAEFHGMMGPQITGSGKMTTVSRSVGAFKQVRFEGSMDGEITIGGQSDIKIQGDDNIVPLVKTEIQGDTLVVSTKGSYSTKNKLQVQFSVPELTSASVDGSGDVTIHKFHGKELSLSINGSGDMIAEGETGKLSAAVNGSGDLRLYNLRAGDTTVSIQGSGDAQVTSNGVLNGSIAGSGNITYKGHPTNVGKSIAGSGEITQAH